MTKSVYLTLIFPFLTITNIFAQNVWSYERCVQEALKNNISVRQDNMALDRAINDLSASKINRMPDLSGNINTSLNNGRALDPITYQYNTQKFLYNNYTLQSSLKLFEGGKQNLTISKNNLAADIQKIKLENTKINTSKDILVQYTDAQMLSELISLWTERVQLLNQQKEKAQLLADNGRKTQSAVWEIDVETGRSLQYIEDLKYRREVALLKLKNLMAMPLQNPILLDKMSNTINPDSTGYTDKELEEITFSTPAYRESTTQVAFAKRELQLAKSAYYPTFSLNGIIGSGYSSKISDGNNLQESNFQSQLSNNVYENVSLNVYIPLISRFQTYYNVKRFKINELQNIEAQKQKSQQIKEILYIQNNQLKHSAIRYQQIKSSVDNYGQILNEANINYQSGRIDTFEYLIKQQQKYVMDQTLIELRYNHMVAKKTIELFRNGETGF